MRVYRVEPNFNDADDWQYAETKSVAHNIAKDFPKDEWELVRITELDVRADKAGVLAILNGAPIINGEYSAWGLTKRGGLEEWKE